MLFAEKKYKRIINLLLQFILLTLIILGSVFEFINFFAVNGTSTFLPVPFPEASIIEFFISLFMSLLICIASIILVRANKIYNLMEYFICISMLLINGIKVLYFFPSLTLDKVYFFYLLKQFVPLITSLLVILFAYLQLGEIKYRKFQ